ncbi:MAG TPA: hypothetical protein VHQ47_18070 [Phycisphaerae bacterium]|jgi:hypothetical protein|nr:hypothetical protein [Phycisphaerae bacterium]
MPTPPSNEPIPAPISNGRPPIGNPSPIENRKSEIENSTGLPFLSTWPRLYAFILLFFAACVLALAWLTRAFS